MTDSKDREISELRSRIARLDDALRQAVIGAAEWARKAGEAQGKLEISEAAGVLDGWKRDCEQLRADNARLREALDYIADCDLSGADDEAIVVMAPVFIKIARAALQETSHDA